MKPAGSCLTEEKTAASSRVTYRAGREPPASYFTRVLLPVCLAPLNNTTGVSERESRILLRIRRLIMDEY